MSTITYDSVSTTTAPTVAADESRAGRRPVWRVGAVAAVAASVVTELFVAVAKAVDVPMESAGFTDGAGEEIPVGGFAMSIVLWSAVGVVLAGALARWAKRPAHTFVVTTVVLTALSLVPAAMANETTTATKVVLVLTHLLTAAIVIPAIASRLPQERTTR